jgi:hypothetical protein
MAPLHWSFALAVLAVCPPWSQDVTSGPEKGKAVPPLKVFAATGPHQGQDVDYAKERGAKATVFLFIPADKWSRPLARFLKKLDEAVPKVGEDAAVVAVWLTDDPAKTKAYLPVAQDALQLRATALTYFTGNKEGPKGWGINADAHATAVVTARGKVAAVFGYRSVNETAVPEVRDALHKARHGK